MIYDEETVRELQARITALERELAEMRAKHTNLQQEYEAMVCEAENERIDKDQLRTDLVRVRECAGDLTRAITKTNNHPELPNTSVEIQVKNNSLKQALKEGE